MTTSIKRTNVVTDRFIKKQERAHALLTKLSKLLAFSLAVAFILTAFLTVTKALPIFYTVSESTVTVAPGDTLWGIARENMGEYPGTVRSYLAEIRRLNNLDASASIVAGTTLVLPIYSYIFS